MIWLATSTQQLGKANSRPTWVKYVTSTHTVPPAASVCFLFSSASWRINSWRRFLVMRKHPMSWSVRWIFWKNPLSLSYVWLRPRLSEASPRFLYRQGGCLSVSWFNIYVESVCLCMDQPCNLLFWQVSLHLAGSSRQNQVLQWDWQSYRYAHGGWCKWPALSGPQ